MKQIFRIFILLLKNLSARITKRAMRLDLPKKEHPQGSFAPIQGRLEEIEDGVFTDNKTANRATILLTGDLLCQRKQQNAHRKENGDFDFSPMFAPMREHFKKADLVVGNLETVCDPTLAYMHESITADGLPFLNAPPQFIDALKQAGFDAVCSANNHNCDGGLQGLLSTLQQLQKASLPTTGIFTGGNQKRYLLMQANGIRIAFLAYATFYNLKSAALTKNEQSAHLNLYSPQKAARNIADAKKDGADFVIVYIHWGSEYTHKVSKKQRKIAKQLAQAGCDLIAGSHSHVLQPFDIVDGVPCLYSFGNFISSQSKDGTRETVMLKLQLQKENGKTALSDLSAVACKTVVNETETAFCVEPVNKRTDPITFDKIKKAVGEKISLQ